VASFIRIMPRVPAGWCLRLARVYLILALWDSVQLDYVDNGRALQSCALANASRHDVPLAKLGLRSMTASGAGSPGRQSARAPHERCSKPYRSATGIRSINNYELLAFERRW